MSIDQRKKTMTENRIMRECSTCQHHKYSKTKNTQTLIWTISFCDLGISEELYIHDSVLFNWSEKSILDVIEYAAKHVLIKVTECSEYRNIFHIASDAEFDRAIENIRYNTQGKQ
jgi:hypothetical protein